MVRRLVSRFSVYKIPFALVTVLMVGGVVLLVGGVLLVSIECFNPFLYAVCRNRGFDVTNEAGKGSGRSKTSWFAS